MVDYNTMQRKRNMVVGGIVIVAFCAFIYMVAIFGDLPVKVGEMRSFQVLANFPTAPGVQRSTPIKYCGYQIGRVTNVSPPFLFTDTETGLQYHQVKVSLAVEKRYIDIPSNIDVLLMKRSMGSSYIEFEFDPEKPRVNPDYPDKMFLIDGMVLQGQSGIGGEFLPKAVQEKIELLVDSVSKLAENMNRIIGDEDNRENLKQALANLSLVTEEATATLRSIRSFSDAGKDTIEDTGERLGETLVELRMLLAKINSGDGSAAKLVNDGRLYENLLDSSQELQMALEQLKKFAAESREKGVKIKW